MGMETTEGDRETLTEGEGMEVETTRGDRTEERTLRMKTQHSKWSRGKYICKWTNPCTTKTITEPSDRSHGASQISSGKDRFPNKSARKFSQTFLLQLLLLFLLLLFLLLVLHHPLLPTLLSHLLPPIANRKYSCNNSSKGRNLSRDAVNRQWNSERSEREQSLTAKHRNSGDKEAIGTRNNASQRSKSGRFKLNVEN